MLVMMTRGITNNKGSLHITVCLALLRHAIYQRWKGIDTKISLFSYKEKLGGPMLQYHCLYLFAVGQRLEHLSGFQLFPAQCSLQKLLFGP